MAKNKNKLNLERAAIELHTKIRKTDRLNGEYVKYRMKHIRGLIYEDGSGGITLKVPDLDCFFSGDDVSKQINTIEERIAAYKAVEPEIKRLKKALAKAECKPPSKPPKHGDGDVKRRPRKS